MYTQSISGCFTCRIHRPDLETIIRDALIMRNKSLPDILIRSMFFLVQQVSFPKNKIMLILGNDESITKSNELGGIPTKLIFCE